MQLWGITRRPDHSAGSEDFSLGLWRPKSEADFQDHDPTGNLIAVGGGLRSLSGAEAALRQLEADLAAERPLAPIYSVTVMVDQVTLQVVGSGARN